MSEAGKRDGEGWALRLPLPNTQGWSTPLLESIEVVLCRPDGSANVGAVCRALKGMGIRSLVIVGRSPTFFKQTELAQMALSAIDLFQQAQFYDTLASALDGVVLAAGFSRRRGNFRKYFAYAPEQLVQKVLALGGARVALVFGNEQAGLSDLEMGCCHVAAAIPTSPAFPSLNLSHAVQLVAYHFFREQYANYTMGMSPITAVELEQTVDSVLTGLESLGLDDHEGRHRSRVFFRDIIARAGLSAPEAHRLQRLLQTVKHINK